ncbi:hypothetical protein CROQUDRAFT_661423, partial [Cronartium quercuum f. sp. fusiforme G11]
MIKRRGEVVTPARTVFVLSRLTRRYSPFNPRRVKVPSLVGRSRVLSPELFTRASFDSNPTQNIC